MWQRAGRRLEETYNTKCAAADRPKQAEQQAAQEREGAAEADALWGQALEDYHAIGARVAKLKAKTMDGVIAKLLAGAQHRNVDSLDDDAHAAIIAGAALDALALTNAQREEART